MHSKILRKMKEKLYFLPLEDPLLPVSADLLEQHELCELDDVDPSQKDELIAFFQKYLCDRFKSLSDSEIKATRDVIEFVLSQENDIPEEILLSGHNSYPFSDGSLEFPNQKLFFGALYEALFGSVFPGVSVPQK